MESKKTGTTWSPKRTHRAGRIAAGLAVLAITAAGIGASSSGASAATTGWGRPAPTTLKPAQPSPILTPSAATNGWG